VQALGRQPEQLTKKAGDVWTWTAIDAKEPISNEPDPVERYLPLSPRLDLAVAGGLEFHHKMS
jgi:hypothetical protein